jgi:hypothetical protein
MSQPKNKKLGFPCSSDRQRATLRRAQVITKKDERPNIRDLSVNSLLQVAFAASATYRTLAGKKGEVAHLGPQQVGGGQKKVKVM